MVRKYFLFSHYVDYFFHFLGDVFWSINVLSFDEVQMMYFLFYFIIYAFGILSLKIINLK